MGIICERAAVSIKFTYNNNVFGFAMGLYICNIFMQVETHFYNKTKEILSACHSRFFCVWAAALSKHLFLKQIQMAPPGSKGHKIPRALRTQNEQNTLNQIREYGYIYIPNH